MWECSNCAGLVHYDEDTCLGCGRKNPHHVRTWDNSASIPGWVHDQVWVSLEDDPKDVDVIEAT